MTDWFSSSSRALAQVRRLLGLAANGPALAAGRLS